MYIDVQIAVLEALVLLVSQLRAGRYRPRVVGRLGESDDWRSILPRFAQMNMRDRPIDAGGLDAAAHRFVVLYDDGAHARRGRGYGRHFLVAAQLNGDIGRVDCDPGRAEAGKQRDARNVTRLI